MKNSRGFISFFGPFWLIPAHLSCLSKTGNILQQAGYLGSEVKPCVVFWLRARRVNRDLKNAIGFAIARPAPSHDVGRQFQVCTASLVFGATIFRFCIRATRFKKVSRSAE